MWLLLVVMITYFGSSKSDCTSPLGMTSRAIKDHQITASSTFSDFTKPQEGRLRNQRIPGQFSTFAGWCADDNDASPYLQIDFQQETVVRELATQGLEEPSGNWVTEYALNYSCDGATWTAYKDEGDDKQKVFKANTDDSTIVKVHLKLPVIARMIRFRPLKKRNHGMACMRVEMYGCKSNPDKQFSDCSVAVGVENGQIANAQMTSSSHSQSHFPYYGRLNNKNKVVDGNVSWGAWCTNEVRNKQYLQVDLGNTRSISGVAIQGYAKGGWVTKFMLQYSLNLKEWNLYKDFNSSKNMVFDGSWDAETIIKHDLNVNVQTRYVRFIPTAWKTSGNICMRVEVYQCIYYKGCPRLPTTIQPTGTITSSLSNTGISPTGEPTLQSTQDKNNNVRNSNSLGSIIQVEFLAFCFCFLCCYFIR
ncbi:EGF-like repeat and discoidin I-like domain-containing protein 3 isoform X2 [Actinia tenebrosa]|uniref:EGF-like repeat and discoidin I-like domain-containing protein 3 isoform X2 n=1 Tax=Actinia tenebrosa TaxID=6105 RepID=A0A6P8HWU5_ACTTE|nr:EGF-like repeat and discoidin I-like domain-containing protein 3 isoform X2 [Actinia tenebrosa]